ncbi:MAG TPA: hypothetical protein VF050_08155 [Moraxellaceae bacterium]
MKFRMLLWYMARRMELLARTHPEFIAKLHGRDFIIQISTDEAAHRYFHIHHNRVASRNSVHPEPSLTLHFVNNDVAFRLLSRADANAFMAAMQAQEVRVIGDYALLMWFMGIGKYLRPARVRRRRETEAHPTG